MDVKKNNSFAGKKTFSVSESALLDTLKLFFAKHSIIFFKHQLKIYFLSIQDYKSKNALMLSQKINFTLEHF